MLAWIVARVANANPTVYLCALNLIRVIFPSLIHLSLFPFAWTVSLHQWFGVSEDSHLERWSHHHDNAQPQVCVAVSNIGVSVRLYVYVHICLKWFSLSYLTLCSIAGSGRRIYPRCPYYIADGHSKQHE